MGTDIHLGVERFTGASWVPVEDVLPTREEYDTAFAEPYNQERVDEFYRTNPTGRDYDTFALLAGVRNGVGFAGKKRCDAVEPAFEGRGIPDDTSFEVEGSHWLGGDHSHTFCSYKEAVSVNWSRETRMFGFVPLDHWAEWKANCSPCPISWCGGVSQDCISEELAQVRVANGDVPKRHDPDNPFGAYLGEYVESSWVMRPTADSPFRLWLLSGKMQALANKHGQENIRICISFDS